MKPCYVGFDTSNYTTSAAICDGEGKIIANLKIPLPVKEGEKGIRQSDAVFEHVRNLSTLMQMLKERLVGYAPIAVGVSTHPRDAEDSYMPCFLAGKSAAYAFAAACNAPVYEFSHQNGHIMAALYSADRIDLLDGGEFLAFHVSGGTTEALLVDAGVDVFSVKLVGNTADINAGQAIDRVGVAMGLRFPCGAQLEALAEGYCGKIETKQINVRDAVCNLSGLENMAKRIYEQSGDEKKTAAFVFDYIRRTLEKMCADVMDKYGEMPVIFAGGVMSNKLMRTSLLQRFNAYFSEPEFSADNAAGIALLCRKKEINL